MAGLCAPWITVEDVADCCQGLVGSDIELFEESAEIASDLLFEASGQQYAGLCERVIRPCAEGPICGVQQLSRGYVVAWDGLVWTTPQGQRTCSCTGVSRVELLNYPVQEIVKVLLDGDELPASDWRLDGHQWLTRRRDADGKRQFWPTCQIIEADSDEPGTFEVTYIYGKEAPLAGQRAAAELACEIFQACPPTGVSVGACKLPSGVVRSTARGVTIEMKAFRTWAWSLSKGWQTGLPLVDAFLSAKNPNGLNRPPLIIDPSLPDAEEVGTTLGS